MIVANLSKARPRHARDISTAHPATAKEPVVPSTPLPSLPERSEEMAPLPSEQTNKSPQPTSAGRAVLRTNIEELRIKYGIGEPS